MPVYFPLSFYKKTDTILFIEKTIHLNLPLFLQNGNEENLGDRGLFQVLWGAEAHGKAALSTVLENLDCGHVLKVWCRASCCTPLSLHYIKYRLFSLSCVKKIIKISVICRMSYICNELFLSFTVPNKWLLFSELVLMPLCERLFKKCDLTTACKLLHNLATIIIKWTWFNGDTQNNNF